MKLFRVGQGFDIHRLVEGRKLVLGGVEIPSSRGLLGHSDGDALLHALSDALLGAIGERDIGYYFPDSMEENKNISSSVILRDALEKVTSNGFKLVNVDLTVITNAFRLSPHVENIKANLSKLLGIGRERIGVKAKTTEGFFFNDEAVMVIAVVLVEAEE